MAMKKSASGKKTAKKPAQNTQRRAVSQQPRTGAPLRPSSENGASAKRVAPAPKGTKKPAAKKTALKKPAQNAPKASQPTAAPQPAAPAKKQKRSFTLFERSPMTAAAKKQTSAAMKKRGGKGSKRGSRGGNYSLYYILAAIVLVIVFIILANTVLFDCTAVVVEGNTTYSAEDITRISGIALGDNLLKADLEAAEQSIVTTFPYIDMAEVKRTSPTKVKIVVTEAEKWFCMRYGSRSYIVSRRGKIVEQGVDAALPVVIGYEAASPVKNAHPL